jgi:hypothetical protein
VLPSGCVITDSEGDVKQTVKELIEKYSNVLGRASYKVCVSVPTKACIVGRKSVKVPFSGMDVRGNMVRFPTGTRGFSVSQNVETPAGAHPLGTRIFSPV